MRVLIGCIGYMFLSDHSLGPKLFPTLARMNWPQGVVVEEMHWSPLAIVWNFKDLKQPYDRVVIVAASDLGKPVGTLTWRRWLGGLPAGEQIQECVNEAATGVISLPNLLVIGGHFDIWPHEVIVIDAQPGAEDAGEEFTQAFKSVVPDVMLAIKAASHLPIDQLPEMEPIHGDRISTHDFRYTFSRWPANTGKEK